MKRNNNNQQEQQCNLHAVRRSFLEWVTKYSPDYVSRRVMSGLLYKYQNGDKEPLFLKYEQLIKDEHYEIAGVFKSCLMHLSLDGEFREWVKAHPD